MLDIVMINDLGSTLEKVVATNLTREEKVLIKFKGAFKEALICTDRRVLIIKSGFMTGQMFGSDAFQLSYGNIASAEVKYRLLSGYFEVSAGGMQNTAKSYWSTDRYSDPAKAPNCVALNSKSQATNFRAACAMIMERVENFRRPQTAPQNISRQPDIAASLERLWKLKMEGAIDQAEYESAKAQLLTVGK
jgi:hypothetical protein